MKKLLMAILLAIFLQGSLSAIELPETPLLIDAEFAHYDGEKIALNGDVSVESALGKLTANSVEIFYDSTQKSTFQQIVLRDQVQIALKTGGELSCSSAEIDLNTYIGNFHAANVDHLVTYRDACRNRSQVAIPLVLKSHDMTLHLAKEQEAVQMREVTAAENVTLNYNDDYVVTANHAHYQQLPEQKGVITLRSTDGQAPCQVVNAQGDRIQSREIQIDTLDYHLQFTSPTGQMNTARDPENLSNLQFSSDVMTWDANQNTLTLQGHVEVNQLGMGTLHTNDELQLVQSNVNGVKQLSSITSIGKTILTYIDDNKKTAHVLTCCGKVVVNHDRLETTMHTVGDQQISFQDELGEIYADRLHMQYSYVNNILTPSKLILEGNVRILNRDPANLGASGQFSQYALADRAEYTPDSKELELFAQEPQRVLFFDKLNSLQVSAPKLNIQRDQVTRKDSIKGSGDVRFSFLDRERALLKKHFEMKEAQKSEDKDSP